MASRLTQTSCWRASSAAAGPIATAFQKNRSSALIRMIEAHHSMVSASDAQAMDQARVVVTWMGAAVALRADPSQCGIATFPEFDVHQLRPGTRRLRCTQKREGRASSRKLGRTAMFRNILVHVPSERPVRPVIEVAVALTMARRSHLDAVAIGYEIDGRRRNVGGERRSRRCCRSGGRTGACPGKGRRGDFRVRGRGQAGRNYLRRQELDGDPGRSRRNHRSACAAL